MEADKVAAGQVAAEDRELVVAADRELVVAADRELGAAEDRELVVQVQAAVAPWGHQVVAVADQEVVPAEEVAGELARFPYSHRIERSYSTFHGSIPCGCQPCGLTRIDSIWLSVAVGPLEVAKAEVAKAEVAKAEVAKAEVAKAEGRADRAQVEDLALAVAQVADRVADRVAWGVDVQGVVGPVLVVAWEAAAVLVEVAPVAAMARVVVAQVAVALAQEVAAAWVVAAWREEVVRVGQGKWSPGLQEPPARSPGI